ncbi:hypothetical protein VPH35_022940 [Triticum aestivum]
MGGGSVSSTTVSPDAMSAAGDGGAAPVVAVAQVSRSLLERRFPQEVWRRGESELRREASHVLISRTPAMHALELRFGQHVLLATVVGDGEQTVTPAAMLVILQQCRRVRVPTTRPVADLLDGGEVLCSEVQEQARLEGLPNQAWTTASVKDLLKQLGGELIEILPPASRRELEVMAWLRDPSFVGKVVTVEIPEPKLTNKPPESMDEYEAMQFELGEYGPSSPRKKNSLLYPVICHMKEVVDLGPLLAKGLPDEWLRGEGEDLTRKHIFKTVLGKIDGTDGDEGV